MMYVKNRIYLRALEADDYKTSIDWRNDDEIWSMLVGPKFFVSSDYEKEWVINTVKDSKSVKLAICLCEGDKYIGNVYLNEINHFNKNASIGILLGDKNEWGKGFATDAIILMLNYAFNVLGLVRVSSRILIDNLSSIKVHKKSGFIEEGILRNAVFKNGEYKDLVILGILKENFSYAK